MSSLSTISNLAIWLTRDEMMRLLGNLGGLLFAFLLCLILAEFVVRAIPSPSDAVVRKGGHTKVRFNPYRPDGSLAWTRQFGSRKVGDQAPDDWAWGVAVDRSNRVAVAGTTDGVLTIRPEKGGYVAFIRVYRQ